MAFSWIDLAVVIAYVIAITAFGARFRKGQRTLHDYFLGETACPGGRSRSRLSARKPAS